MKKRSRIDNLRMFLIAGYLWWAVAYTWPARAAIPIPAANAPAIQFVLAMPQPQTHYCEVEMTLTGAAQASNAKKNGYYDIRMPVWTPGSYLVREYAKNVEGFTATANGQPVRTEKVRKDTWRIYTSADELRLHYRVYANELSVRTSLINADHAFLLPAGVFMYHDALKHIPMRVVVQPAAGWKAVATSLKPVAGQTYTYEAADLDELIDSPIEVGTHRTFGFTAAGVPHTVAMVGDVDYDEAKLKADYQRVCEAAASVVGGQHPCDRYLFIVHHVPNGSGGLEHLNSTTIQPTRAAYSTTANYKRFWGLVAHEYFHLWNVKRIRPIALGPFDYANENYTHMLWFSEGCTSYYGGNILLRAGFTKPEEYVESLANEITQLENQPGNRVQSVAESSWDAWIKAYRPNENSSNSTISYYAKGSILGNLLNLAILAGSKGERNLDHLMRYLYAEYYQKQHRGFTDAEFRQAAEQVAGRSLATFFDVGVNSSNPIDYNAYFAPVGLQLKTYTGSSSAGFLGAAAAMSNGKLNVTTVRKDSPAEKGGLNVGDEILAIDSLRVADDLTKALEGRRTGEKINLLVNRAGELLELPITLTANPLVTYRLEPVAAQTPEQQALLRKWLFLP